MFFRLRIHRTHRLSRVKIRDLRADQFSPQISHEALQTPATGLTTPHSRGASKALRQSVFAIQSELATPPASTAR
eukprot:symbB.v1.2.017168.t1/scaffold1301.1/size126134/3